MAQVAPLAAAGSRVLDRNAQISPPPAGSVPENFAILKKISTKINPPNPPANLKQPSGPPPPATYGKVKKAISGLTRPGKGKLQK